MITNEAKTVKMLRIALVVQSLVCIGICAIVVTSKLLGHTCVF